MTPLAASFVSLVLARAPEGETHEAVHRFLGLPSIVWQFVNLGLFLALLVWLLKKPVTSFFGERQAAVAKALAKADDDRRRAEALSKELASRLAQIETELLALREHAKTEAEAERLSLTRQAEEDARRIVGKTSSEMESRVRAARAELTAYAGDLAIEIAREVLKKSVTPDDQARLVNEGMGALLSGTKS